MTSSQHLYQSAREKIIAASIQSPMRCHSVGSDMPGKEPSRMQSAYALHPKAGEKREKLAMLWRYIVKKESQAKKTNA